MSDEIFHKTISELRKMLDSHQISPVELVKFYLNRSKNINSKINYVLTHTEDLALSSAKLAEKTINSKKSKLLTGIPSMVKDNISTLGIETTAASKILSGYIPPFDATVIKKLHQDQAIICGKTNLDEFAMGSSTENSAFGSVKNPINTNKVPGGSSGGSAASVLAGQCVFALGSDTGGSIRQPASFCGITGMKPTYGLVSRFGLIAFGSSLDQIGPLAKSVKDCAIILNSISSVDKNDSTSIKRPFKDFGEKIGKSIKGLKIAIPKEYLVDGIEPGVRNAYERSLIELERGGAILEEITLPLTDHALSVYYIIAPAEASSNLSRYDGIKYGTSVTGGKNSIEHTFLSRGFGFGDEVKRRILLGTYVLSSGYYDAYYLKAQKVRTLIRNEFNNAFKNFDAIVTPTTPNVAFNLNEKINDPFQMYLNDVCTIPVNIAGLPAISVPNGIENNLPTGLQIIGPRMGDPTVIQIAHYYEEISEWKRKIQNIIK